MANNEMLMKVEALIEYEAMIEELKAEADEIKDEIKAQIQQKKMSDPKYVKGLAEAEKTGIDKNSCQ